ncbi:enoyl-CoA hydratase [Rhodococcus tukisamuensis]|uniref:Enoyl-CoA hydratase n=1 Tax=Rhodococcus tukisamuensis TaxID=168276 RepID=A0A1G6MCG5_9NOCA|nr:enoyl-CoA hydratase [Rhodococcus tukisamuensis]SDC52635.1 enoyl-CoA hydratase [Rhodococcus tukisamuensis]
MSTDTNDVLVGLADGVLRITVNRPARMNSVTTETLDAAADALDKHAGDRAVRAVVLTGAGRAFCTGADLSTVGDLSGPPDPSTVDAANRLVAALRAFPRPVVAAVNGPAAGVGVSLALGADLTVAAESSYLLLAFTKIGLMPDGGATALVAASIGRARAMRMALLAERLPAADALDAGLIARVFPDATFADDVEALVRGLVDGPSDAFAATKTAINDATLGQLDPAFARERAGQLELLAAADFAEGVDAFLGKRPAVFGR